MSAQSTIAVADVQSYIDRHGRAALAELDSLSPADPDTTRKLAEAMRQFVCMRDALIAAQRQGLSCRTQLQRTNALISSIFGVEFPVAGLQWQRVCDTRDALRQLLNDVARTPPAPSRQRLFDGAGRKRIFGAAARYGALGLVAALCVAAAARRSR